jgi:putative inorganic carbon (HCO3(-)) transporter
LVPLGMFRFFDERSVLLRMLAAFATVCTTLGIALTFSRGAAVAFVMLLILMAVLRYIKLRHLILVTLGVALMLSAVPQYRTRLLTLVNVASVVSGEGASADGAIRSRATEGLTAVLVFLEHPIIGVGPGMFRYYYQESGYVCRPKTGRRITSFSVLPRKPALLA